MILKRWRTREDLDTHATGAPLARSNELNEGLLTQPQEELQLVGHQPLGSAR